MAVEEHRAEPLPPPKVGHITVYDKEGKPHSHSRLNANDLVQHCGWHYSVAQAPGVATQKVVVVVAKSAKPVDPENAEEIDLNSLTVDELIPFAKKHFDMDFDPTDTKEKIIAAIVEERGE